MSRILIDKDLIIEKLIEEFEYSKYKIEDLILFTEKRIKDHMRRDDMPVIIIPRLFKMETRPYTIGSMIGYKYVDHLKRRLNGIARDKSLKIFEKDFNLLMPVYLRRMEEMRSRMKGKKKIYWDKIFNELK